MKNKWVIKESGTIYEETFINGNTITMPIAYNVDSFKAERIVMCCNTHDELVKALQDLSKYVDALIDAPNHGNNDFVSKVAYLFNDLEYYQRAAKVTLQKVTSDTPINQ